MGGNFGGEKSDGRMLGICKNRGDSKSVWRLVPVRGHGIEQFSEKVDSSEPDKDPCL